MKKEEILIDTNDDWYPNYPNNQVQLSYHGCINPWETKDKQVYRVSCWGNDDFGIEKDFGREDDAIHIYNSLKILPVINHSTLYNLGFITA